MKLSKMLYHTVWPCLPPSVPYGAWVGFAGSLGFRVLRGAFAYIWEMRAPFVTGMPTFFFFL